MAYTTCVGILGVAASVFPIVYIGIKLVGNQLGTGMAGQATQATQVSVTQWDLNFLKYVYLSDYIVSDCCLTIVRQEQGVRWLSPLCIWPTRLAEFLALWKKNSTGRHVTPLTPMIMISR